MALPSGQSALTSDSVRDDSPETLHIRDNAESARVRSPIGQNRLQRLTPRLHTKRFAGASASAAIVFGTVLALATFAFQTAQSWVDESPDRQGLDWAFPVLVGLIIVSVSTTAYLLYWLAHSPRPVTEADPTEVSPTACMSSVP